MLNNKEAVVVIVWYAVYTLCYVTMHSLVMISRNDLTLLYILFVTSIISYTLLGVIGEVFIGRYRLINFSMWIQWLAVTVSTLIYALKFARVYDDVPHWSESVIVVVPLVALVFGHSAFQITAIQFGTDQLQGAPSDELTAFIFWYFCMEQLPRMVLQWSLYLLSQFVTDFAQIQLGCCLLCVVLLSFIICAKSCFMTNWFLLGRDTTGTCMCKNRLADHEHNPYSLVYQTIKFALKHKHPLQRSALTYWEDKIPSRIDLGKSKYGGPFTSEEVENVKTFFQLIKVLLSLSGILVVSFLMHLITYHKVTLASDNSQIVLTRALSDAVILGILVLLYAFLFLPCCRKCLPRMLKRIWIGALATLASALSILLIESIVLEHQQILPCYLSFDKVTVNPYLLLIPSVLCTASYTVFTISLFEFIIAQSPQTMKGILIGLCYSLRLGLPGLLILVEFHIFEKYLTHNNVLSCATAYYLEITLIGLLSVFIYTVVAYKYKLRERDEVINVHMFAEEYYTK